MDENDPILWQLLLQLLLIMLNAVFACAEIAVISINDKKLEKMAAGGDKRALRLVNLTAQPARFLSVIQIGITLAGFLGSAFAADNFSDKLTSVLVNTGIGIPVTTLRSICVILITLILSYFTLVLGELVPKRIAMRNAEKIGLAMSGLISAISKIFTPIVWLLTKSTNAILRLLGIDPNAHDSEVTEEEIRLMVDAGSEKGAINSDERSFIHNIFDFNDKSAQDIMTYRTDVTLLWLEDSPEEWERTIIDDAHTFYPICNKSVDDVVGILSTKSYFRQSDRSQSAVMKSCVTPACFIPETLRINVLFHNMKKTRNPIAVVLDEFGGMSGIVTMTDVLEELVGDLEEDTPLQAAAIMKIDENTWRISGSAAIEKVSARLEIPLPDDDFDTFGGLVFSLLGAIPSDDEKPELTGHGLHIRVESVKDRRLETAIVSIIPTP